MNKRYIYIIGIVVVLLAIVIWEQIIVSNYLGNIEKEVQAIIVEVENQDNVNQPQLYDKIVSLEKTWKNYETTLCFMINLKDVEDLGIELTKMKVYILENNATEFKASLALMLFYIDSYYNLMGISLENIF